MVAGLEPRSRGVRGGPCELLESGELERGVRLLPEAFADTQRIAEERGSPCRRLSLPGLDDPIAELSDYRSAARMFDSEYIVEEVPGGHFMHREHPDAFAERLLMHL